MTTQTQQSESKTMGKQYILRHNEIHEIVDLDKNDEYVTKFICFYDGCNDVKILNHLRAA